MATPEDIIEAKRITSAKAYAQSVAKSTAAPAANPNALAELQASVAAGKQFVQSKNIEIATIALEQAVNTGNKTAIVDTAKAVAAAQGGSATTQAANAIAAVQAATPQPVLNEANIARGDQIKWVGGVNGSWQVIKGTNAVSTGSTDTTKIVSGGGKVETRREFIGSGPSRVLRIYYNDGTFQDFASAETVVSDGSNANSGSSNADLLALIASLQNTIANLSTKSATDVAATKAAADLKERQSAFDVLYAEMDALGLAALVEPLRGLIQKDVSPSEFAVELRQSEAYKMRFAANEARLKKGLRVLQPGEYIRVEDAYRQTLRSYGLSQFDNDAYVRQFIENDISAAELSDRVSMAVQRVQNADPAITRTLRDYYGIGQADLVAYVLDPNQQLQKIQRQIAAAEIGTAARVQGIEAGVGVAEQLAAQGITQAQAQKGYATIADILPTAEKLSQIYGATMEGYDLGQAEQEVFNQLASAQRRRERLTQREVAEFSGQSGVARGSLAQPQQRGQF